MALNIKKMYFLHHKKEISICYAPTLFRMRIFDGVTYAVVMAASQLSWLLSAVRTHHAQAQPELRKRRPSAERAELHFHTCSATWRPSCAFL